MRSLIDEAKALNGHLEAYLAQFPPAEVKTNGVGDQNMAFIEKVSQLSEDHPDKLPSAEAREKYLTLLGVTHDLLSLGTFLELNKSTFKLLAKRVHSRVYRAALDVYNYWKYLVSTGVPGVQELLDQVSFRFSGGKDTARPSQTPGSPDKDGGGDE
jgi:hypothetical protein